jgi:hypothetical protein
MFVSRGETHNMPSRGNQPDQNLPSFLNLIAFFSCDAQLLHPETSTSSVPPDRIRRRSEESMLYPSYLAGSIVLAILPLLFVVARQLLKRSRRLPWTLDDTLLVLSLVFAGVFHTERAYC